MAKFVSLVSIIVAVSTLPQHEVTADRPIRDGFYKIESVIDSSALTATWTGRPRAVITDTWQEMSTQEWRVRAVNGGPEEIIRNENVKDNEVTKLDNREHANWNFVQIENQENTFTLRKDGGNCLKNNGSGERISFESCNPDSKAQQWHFVFLFTKF